MKNVADTLRAPSRRWPWISGGAAAVGLVAAAVIVGPSFAANMNAAPSPTPTTTEYVATLTPAEIDAVQQIAADQQAKIAADQAAADAAAASEKQAALVAGHQQQTAGGPVKCDAGYTANAVDAAGNESNCVKNGPAGTPCVAYDANNNCTQYYKP